MNRLISRCVVTNFRGARGLSKSFYDNSAAKVTSTSEHTQDHVEEKPSSANDRNQHDVAIVGGGMVGMALACSLATSPLTKNLNVAIIDSSPALGKGDSIKKEDPPDSRVSTVTPATISLFKDSANPASAKLTRPEPFCTLR